MRRHRNTAKPANESITMATTSNQTNISFDQEAADHPYTAYKKQPEPEPYAVLNQTNVSPSSDQQSADHPYTAYQKQPEPEPYAALNQTNMSTSSDHQSPDHPYTTYQKQPDLEPYAALNQMPPPNPTAMASHPDYQNVNDYKDYEDNLNTNFSCILEH